MDESRQFPRFIPRAGKKMGIWFGDNAGGEGESAFTELRRKWRKLVEEDRRWKSTASTDDQLGDLSEGLKYGKEAVALRIECTNRVRNELLKVRRMRGLPDEDPKEGLVETWRGGGWEARGQDEGWKFRQGYVRDIARLTVGLGILCTFPRWSTYL